MSTVFMTIMSALLVLDMRGSQRWIGFYRKASRNRHCMGQKDNGVDTWSKCGRFSSDHPSW